MDFHGCKLQGFCHVWPSPCQSSTYCTLLNLSDAGFVVAQVHIFWMAKFEWTAEFLSPLKLSNLFFPSNARWLSPGRFTNRKYNCMQIQRIRSAATSVLWTVCNQKNWLDRYIIHCAVTVQPTETIQPAAVSHNMGASESEEEIGPTEFMAQGQGQRTTKLMEKHWIFDQNGKR